MMILVERNGRESLERNGLDRESLDRDSLGRDSLASFNRAQTFVWVRLISFNCDAGDFRWTMLALILRWLALVAAFGHRQLALWTGNVLRRAWQGARFAAEIRDADSMVAAGNRYSVFRRSGCGFA